MLKNRYMLVLVSLFLSCLHANGQSRGAAAFFYQRTASYHPGDTTDEHRILELRSDSTFTLSAYSFSYSHQDTTGMSQQGYSGWYLWKNDSLSLVYYEAVKPQKRLSPVHVRINDGLITYPVPVTLWINDGTDKSPAVFILKRLTVGEGENLTARLDSLFDKAVTDEEIKRD